MTGRFKFAAAALLALAALPACAATPAPKPALVVAPEPSAYPTLDCFGDETQGGFVICRSAPDALVFVDDLAQGRTNKDGYVAIGFDRDAPAAAHIEVRAGDGRVLAAKDATVAPREYSVQRIDGLPPATVTPTAPEVLARIAREQKVKAQGFASRADAAGFLEPWIWPVRGIVSSPWGNQRVLNGEPRAPHYGVDIAAPVGTPIVAPASGIVALAEPDLHFEGGLVMIDHGQGLISLYLHMSRLDVIAGEAVTQGQLIGAVGAKGRATGPHLCWRMKWRDRNLDPSLAPMTPLEPPPLAAK